MSKKFGIPVLALGLILIAPLITAAEHILIQVHLFQGVWMEDQPGLKQAQVLSAASRPELSFLRDKVTGSESELTAAVINVLSDLYGLQTVEDLIVYEKTWNEDDIIIRKSGDYELL
jgi:hypothetical protein